jgi:hypothetical protein
MMRRLFLVPSLNVVQENAVAKKIADIELRSLALVGARARLAALQGELASLLATFPELRSARGAKAAAEGSFLRRNKPGRKHPMSAAEKKAVSERMRKYWAERRAGKK